METLEVEENQPYSTSREADEQIKHNVIYKSNRALTQSKLLHLKHMVNVLSSSEWRDSWKTLKHRMKMEKRSMRPDPFRLFRESEIDIMPTASEWKDSSKFTSQPLRQEPGLWQEGCSTTPQMRVDRAGPNNGPILEQSWEGLWRFSRHQQSTAQTIQGKSNVTHWWKSWKWSTWSIKYWTEQVSRENWVN